MFVVIVEKTRTKTPVRALRRILEDYLEIDSHSHEVLRELLSSEMLIRYFKRRRYKANAMIFDIGDEADKVLILKNLEMQHNNFYLSDLLHRERSG